MMSFMCLPKEKPGHRKKPQVTRPPIPSVSSEQSSASGSDNAHDYNQTPKQQSEDQPYTWPFLGEMILGEIEDNGDEMQHPVQQPQQTPPYQDEAFEQHQPQIMPADPIQQAASAQPVYRYITVPSPTPTFVADQPQHVSMTGAAPWTPPYQGTAHRDRLIHDVHTAGIMPGNSANMQAYPHAVIGPSRHRPEPLFTFANPLVNHDTGLRDPAGRCEHVNARTNAPMHPGRRSAHPAACVRGSINATELSDVLEDIQHAMVRIEVEMRALKRRVNYVVGVLADREREGRFGRAYML